MKILSYLFTSALFLIIWRYVAKQNFFSGNTISPVIDQTSIIATWDQTVNEQVETNEKIDFIAWDNSKRVRSLYSNKYTLVWDKSMKETYQVWKDGFLTYHITQSWHLWRVIVIQTYDYSSDFLRKYQPYSSKPIYINSTKSKKWLTRDLYDGMAEMQFVVTEIAGRRIYVIDTFGARWCSEDEICLEWYLDILGPSLDVAQKSNTKNSINLTNITLSQDKKNILADWKIIFSIDNNVIHSFMTKYADLCDESNIDNNSTRKSFCTDISVFTEQTNFKSIKVSPDKTTVAFVIESTTLAPDTAIWFFQTNNPLDTTTIQTNYYLWNDFLEFSPNGGYYIFQGSCWEWSCWLSVNETKTHKPVTLINPFVSNDEMRDLKFIKRVSDTSFQYTSNWEFETNSIK